MDETCKHEKVYANYTLTSDPPQYPWICRKCGKTGVDRGTATNNEYDGLVKIFSGKVDK